MDAVSGDHAQQTPQSLRPNPTAEQTATQTNSSHWNALKHGFYSRSILLPEDDALEFQRERGRLFHEFRPQTVREAKCVEAMADCQWQWDRSRPWQAQFDAQAAPATDVAGRICEPAGHKRLHSTMDVTVQRQRIQRMEAKAHSELMAAQKQRRQGLVEGAVKLPAGCYMEVDGQIIGPVIPPATVPVPETAIETDKTAIAASPDRGNGFYLEPKETGAEEAWRFDARERLTGSFGAYPIFAEATVPQRQGMDTVRERMTWVGSA